jgi:hypothetical protein
MCNFNSPTSARYSVRRSFDEMLQVLNFRLHDGNTFRRRFEFAVMKQLKIYEDPNKSDPSKGALVHS